MRIAHIAARPVLALWCLGLASCSLLVSGDDFIGEALPNCPAATALVSPITGTTTLLDVVSDPLCPDYVANGRVAVMASLTLSPGVFIEFAPRTGIDVATSAALIARGTSSAPIVLRGEDWDGVAVRSADVLNEFDYVTVAGASGDLHGAAVFVDRGAALAVRHSVVRDSGTIGLWLQNAEAEFIFDDSARLLGFVENRFESNVAAPLRLSFSQVPMLDAATVYDPTEAPNGAHEVEVRWGGLRENATVPALNVPYHFVGDGADRLFFTGSAAEVTFAAGVNVVVDSMLRIDLNGKVTMIGTSALPIVIRGVTATGGVWNRMTVGAMGDVALDNVVLSDAGADYFFLRTVLAISGKASIENVTITRSGGSCVVLAEMSVVTPRDLADGSNGNSFTGCGPMPITNLRP